MRALSLHIAALMGFALPAQAVTLAECDRRLSNPFAGISNRWFDRREMVRDVIATQMAGAPALFSFQRLADALKGKGRDIEIATADMESCACAAVHPDLKGAKTGFELEE